ncbi:carbon storage regulator [Roseimaritima sediminicola]|uniref:carbon storage regulator n=1 Tax=Roseimaritima sediminicola TaxID=2662066 RepID=UPI0013871AB7|nr:carbon storage regulator [Roseimaritima sediminicola]
MLSRKPQETITLPDLSVLIRVLRCGAHQTQIGIDAPRSIRVLRGELGQEDLRSLSDESPSEHLLQWLEQLESQVSALVELSPLRDRSLAAAVAEDAQQTVGRIRRQIVRGLAASTGVAEPAPECAAAKGEAAPLVVRQEGAPYRSEALLPSA